MNDKNLATDTHTTYSDLLPIYAAGHINDKHRRELEHHLQDCPDCQTNLALWRSIGTEVINASQQVTAPPELAERALKKMHFAGNAKPLYNKWIHLRKVWQLLCAQIPLVKREIWPSVTLVMAIGCLIAILFEKEAVLRVLAPLVTAASLAVIYGPEHDPIAELALSTPTSPWKILLARVTLVFSYNLGLALVVSLFLPIFFHIETLGGLIISWLAPMTFLSALALVLSLWVGTSNALIIAYLGWLAQFLPISVQPYSFVVNWVLQMMSFYEKFWQTPALLFSLAALFLISALWSVQYSERTFYIQAG